MNILLTGGAGYIGSHVLVELLAAGHEVAVVDNLSNSSERAFDRVAEIAGKRPKFYKVDILDGEELDRIFSENGIEAVVHLAGLKAVGESVRKPFEYYRNNVGGAISLLGAMARHGVKRMIFSSSATIYGVPASVPIYEDFPLSAINPYGATKLVQENMFRDLCAADKDFSVVSLRYFNPVGAHPSGLIGEAPNGIPNNLTPYITQVAIGRLSELGVYGGDYPTPDGTCVRDYIHIVDLARGHIAALAKLASGGGFSAYNLGTGRGYSVLEVISEFERACGRRIVYSIKPRRDGDVAAMYASPDKAARELGWHAELGLAEMCRDAWNWQKKNPDGYE